MPTMDQCTACKRTRAPRAHTHQSTACTHIRAPHAYAPEYRGRNQPHGAVRHRCQTKRAQQHAAVHRVAREAVHAVRDQLVVCAHGRKRAEAAVST